MDPVRTFCVTGILLTIFGLLLVCHAQASDNEGNDSDGVVAHGRQKRSRFGWLKIGKPKMPAAVKRFFHSSPKAGSPGTQLALPGPSGGLPGSPGTQLGSRMPLGKRILGGLKSAGAGFVRNAGPLVAVGAAGAFGSALGGMALDAYTQSRRNRPPYFEYCPPDAVVDAPPRKTKVKHSWKMPTATDPDGEKLRPPVKMQGFEPGSEFNEGVTIMRYEVTDRDGLQASCVFSVTVRVNRCPNAVQPPEPLDLHCDVNWEFVNGSVCSYMCARGYRLVGSANLTCQEVNGELNWSDDIPQCEVPTCQPLSKPPNGDLQCTSGSEPGSSCRVLCGNGYRVQGEATVECLDNASWSGNMAECEGIECPAPAVVANGTYDCSSGWQHPASCTLICDAGLTPYPPSTSTIQCQANGRWSRQGSCRAQA